MPAMRKPTTIIRSVIKISHHDGARQLVILCHEGWKPMSRQAGVFLRQSGDAATVKVPPGSKVFFYVREGVKEAGFSVLDNSMARQRSR